MISPQHIDVAWISQLVCQKQCDNLNIILIPVYVITLEKVLFMGRRTNLIEKTDKVLQLPVNVA